MTAHPLDAIIQQNVKPPKANFSGYVKARTVFVATSYAEVADLVLSDVVAVVVGNYFYTYDAADTTTAHNPPTVLVSLNGRRYKLQTIVGSGTTFAGAIEFTDTTQATAFDAAAAEFKGGVGISKNLIVNGKVHLKAAAEGPSLPDLVWVNAAGVIDENTGLYYSAENKPSVACGGNKVFGFEPGQCFANAGNFGVGTQISNEIGWSRALTVNHETGVSGVAVILAIGDETKGYFRTDGGEVIVGSYANIPVYVRSNNQTRIILEADGTKLRPATDNVMSLGDGTSRYTVVYATTGAINTSDVRQKKLRASDGALRDAELDAWGEVRSVVFQQLDAVATKGEDKARIHVGYVAQDVAAAFRKHGLDPHRYALFCEDKVFRTETHKKSAPRQKTTTIRSEEFEVVVIDGRAIRKRSTKTISEPVFTVLPLHDEQGRPIMKQVPEFDAAGKQIGVKSKQAIHREPVMEDFEIEETFQVDTGDTRLGLRYEQCLVMECSYLRRLCAQIAPRK